MVLVEAWKRVVVERFAVFSGRAGRAEFWWFILATFIVSLVLGLLSRASVMFLVLYVVYGLAVLIPYLAVSIRRLHDTGRTGWWLLIGLVPVAGVVILVIFYATDGEPGPNTYGPPAAPLPA